MRGQLPQGNIWTTFSLKSTYRIIWRVINGDSGSCLLIGSRPRFRTHLYEAAVFLCINKIYQPKLLKPNALYSLK